MIAKKTSLMELVKDSMTRIKKHCSDFDPLPHLKMMRSMLKQEHIQRQFKNWRKNLKKLLKVESRTKCKMQWKKSLVKFSKLRSRLILKSLNFKQLNQKSKITNLKELPEILNIKILCTLIFVILILCWIQSLNLRKFIENFKKRKGEFK